MSRIRLKYVQAWVDREGRAHHYFRRRGFPRVRLPGLPGSADFMAAYQAALTKAGHGRITTEIIEAPEFYFAEDYHQQYLQRVPNGYCGVGGTGVSCPVGLTAAQ